MNCYEAFTVTATLAKAFIGMDPARAHVLMRPVMESGELRRVVGKLLPKINVWSSNITTG